MNALTTPRQIVGNGSGDAKAAILRRSSSSGQSWMYLMNGRTIVTSANVNAVSELIRQGI